MALVLSSGSSARALAPTPLSAGTVPEGKSAVAGFLGFPYLSVQGTYGVTDKLDVSLVARTAWANIQRAGIFARYRVSDGDRSASALRFGANGWMTRPDIRTWITVTGEQDLSVAAAFLHSWTTPRGTVMTFDVGVLGIGNRQPPALPLQGPAPWMAFGANVTFRVAAEIPYENGLLLTFDLGMDLHTSGFDEAVAMPAFSVGLGFVP